MHLYNKQGGFTTYYSTPIGEQYKERNAEVQVDSVTMLDEECTKATVPAHEE
jgi:hypothetical protein